jgi:hypothetical protein
MDEQTSLSKPPLHGIGRVSLGRAWMKGKKGKRQEGKADEKVEDC